MINSPEDFVDSVRRCILDKYAADLLRVVEEPPGRRPDAALLALSGWYKTLDADARGNVASLVEMAARGAVHGVLCMLDGASTVESHVGPKGHFELKWVKDGRECELVSRTGGVLHELL
jgi:hypothetical protein